MKKWTYVLVVVFGCTTAFGSGPEPAGDMVRAHTETDQACELTVTASNSRARQTYRYEFESLSAMGQASWPVKSGELMELFASEGECKVSITVTVRVGIDSSYAEASLSVSDVPCDQVSATVSGLRRQLIAALK